VTLRLSGGRRLQSPPGETARPTAARVRQAVLNLLAADLPGCRWLDLCCGSGVMACEALQRGAREVVAIERDRRVAATARANLQAVAAGMAPPGPLVRVIQADARRWLSGQAPGLASRGRPEGERPFDLVYCDPPWPAGLHGPLSEAVALGGWIRPGGTLVWECPSDRVPQVPAGWSVRDQRRYGGSTVVLLELCRSGSATQGAAAAVLVPGGDETSFRHPDDRTPPLRHRARSDSGDSGGPVRRRLEPVPPRQRPGWLIPIGKAPAAPRCCRHSGADRARSTRPELGAPDRWGIPTPASHPAGSTLPGRQPR